MPNTALAFPAKYGYLRGARLAALLPVLACVAWSASMPTFAQTQAGSPAIIGQPVEPLKVTADPARLRQGGATRNRLMVPEGEPLPQQLPPPRKPVFDPKVQIRPSGASGASALREGPAAPGQISAPMVTVPGAPAVALPPDTVGDVGRSHYVQMSNNSGPGGTTGFFIIRKDGTPPPARPAPALSGSGPFNFGALWPGGACNSNLGDPIVVYDHLADRWLLSQFAQPGGTGTAGFLCVAISQTPDPTDNTWFLYTMPLHTNLPDYPKIGVWSDGYYVTTYESPNLGLYVLDRANMLIGTAAGFFKQTITSLGAAGVRDTRILPADLDGAAPPAGAPGLFVRTVDGQQDAGTPTDRIEVYEGRVNWLAGTFTTPLVDTINPTAFDIMTCNRGGIDVRSCIPQPGAGTQNLDALSNRPMMQLRYRNFGTYQTLVFNQTIDVQGSIQQLLGFTPLLEVAGVRWTELRKTGANWALQQEGSYAPQPNGATLEVQLLHRWMGSAAMDRFGNLGLGYSIVNGDATNPVNPGLRYTGRRFDDVLDLLPQGEQVIVNGTVIAVNDDALTTAPAPLSERWGDYSTLSIDPVDDCTFWFTSHVAGGPQVPAGTVAARPTRIASFRFSDCATDLAISKSGSPNIVTAGNLLTYNLLVSNLGPLDASGVTVVDTLPAGVTYVSNNAGCTLAGNTLTCNLGLLAKDASRAVQVLVRVQPNVVSGGANSVTNVATVTSNQGESNLANNTATLITQVVDSADLSVSKQCKPDGPALSGSPATCTMFVNNAGPSDARSVVLTDTLLGSGSFTITSTSLGNPTCTSVGGVVTCNLGTLAAGASVTVAVSFTSTGSVDVNDTARVSSSTPDPDTGNNTATGRVSFVASADLAITKLDTPDPVVAGTNLTYTIRVTNAGPSAATNVVVTDVLPAQVKVLSATPSVGSCGGTTGAGDPAQPLTCNLGTLVSGASAAITVVVKVDSEVPQGFTLVNNATVSSDASDVNNANNKATATTLVNAVADLLAVKTSDKAAYKPSTLVTYTITVTNQGPSKALAVQVTDNLPTDRQALYQSDTGGCTKSGLTLTCQLGDMAVGTTRSFNVYVVVKGSRGDVTNTATAVSTTTDLAPANNISTRIVRIGN